MYYIYSDLAGEGDYADSYEEAVKIAKEYAIHGIFLSYVDSNDIIEIQIFKLHETLTAKAAVDFTIAKAKENESNDN